MLYFLQAYSSLENPLRNCTKPKANEITKGLKASWGTIQ